jgi:hypothetical protein
MSVIVGAHSELLERSDAGISYSFTQASASYGATIPSVNVGQVAATSVADANIHGLDFEAGHWLRDGLRVMVGYRLQLLDDGTLVPSSPGSVLPVWALSTTHHTVTLGVTLTSDLVSGRQW